MGVRRILVGTFAAPLLLTVSACGDDTSVANPPIKSARSSSPTAEPHASVSDRVVSFVRQWAAEDIRMQNSGDSRRFRHLSQHCHDCLSLADRVDGIYARGGFIRTAGWTIKRVEIVRKHAGSYLVDLKVVSKPTYYRESAGGQRRSYPGGPATYQLRVDRIAHGLTVGSLGRIAA
jgi:hypothetical protein